MSWLNYRDTDVSRLWEMGVAVNIDQNVAISALFIKYTTEVIIDRTFNSNDSS